MTRADVIGPRANPLAGNPMRTRDDLARAVVALHEPTVPFLVHGARARLGSFGASFEQASAELEGFSRPFYGIVPLVAGGGTFERWDLIRAGLAAGSDPDHPGYWGAVDRDTDQRMVEQAAIGLALAFCPEHMWEPLDASAKDRLAEWLHGIARYEPAPNNWQFFRVLVNLGLERVGRPLDADKVEASLDLLESYRRGDYWYVDGVMENVDYYVPMAFHTYGLMYAAANDLGLGDDDRAAAYRERARGFAADFAHWFGPDGAAVAMGRSLTYRFATASFWGALAWADVEPDTGWGAARGMLVRHLRWWTDKAISDRDGVLSVGYGYDNRVLRESYNSPGSPYWCMKVFAALGAPAEHPFWAEDEAPHPADDTPRTIADAGWVTRTDDAQTVALVASTGIALNWPEQAAAKYRKLAYSSRYALTADHPDHLGRIVTDSTVAVTDDEGNRRVRLGVEAAGVEEGVAWSTWHPLRGVRVDTVCWFDGEWHGRLHRVTTDRRLGVDESGFALGCDAATDPAAAPAAARLDAGPGIAAAATWDGDSRIVDLSGGRSAAVFAPAVDSNLLHPHVVIPVLRVVLEAGQHDLAGVVRAAPDAPGGPVPPIAAHAGAVLDRVSAEVRDDPHT